MSRCIIITSYIIGKIRDVIDIKNDDFIICADGGYELAEAENIVPNVLIGDFDSYFGEMPDDITVIKVPAEKDDTDTLLCIKYGIEKGFSDFTIIGGIGGRFDHTYANLQTLAFLCEKKMQAYMTDSENIITMIEGSKITVNKTEGCKLSLFSFSDKCTGVTSTGLKYPLSDFTLENTFPIGVSNEFTNDKAVISNKTGKLLIIISKE
ncbi:MAG: thiamine diphosphokinase [Bacillota bacterium]|nr:thiamine diphosphokinase [Bacillota bacterium]